MKGKISLLVVLIITFYIGILVGTPFKAEVVDLKQFTDYYEEGAAENGGWEVQKDNFYTFSREYSLIGEEGGGVQELPKIDENDIPEKKTYIVQKGDTLSEIAEAYNMGLSVLMANNPGVSASNLRVGQEITVLTGNGIFYKVSKGDSLSKIAELFKVDVEEIKKINLLCR